MNLTNRTFLLESLGVPEGIIDSTELLYKKILSEIQSLDDISEDFEFDLSTNITISDFKLKKISIIIDFVETDQVNEVRFYSMSFHHQSRYEDGKIISKPYSGGIKLSIGIAYPEGTTAEEVKKYFKDEKNDLITSLAHELKHSYDDFKKPVSGLKGITNYFGIQRTNFGIKPISDFLFSLYFTHSIENLVRPSEFATLMNLNKINKKDFYNFITSSEMYNKLKNAYNFSYEGLVNDLKSNIPQIEHLFSYKGWDIPGNDNELIDEFLRIVYVNIVNNTIGKLKELMTENLFEEFLGFIGDKDRIFNSVAKFASRFENREQDFYKYEEKRMKYVSEKMMKKIVKLFAIANDDKKSIKDWELHQKISGKTNETIDRDYKYKLR